MISWISKYSFKVWSWVFVNSVTYSFIAAEFDVFNVVHVRKRAGCALSASAPAFFEDEVIYLQIHKRFVNELEKLIG